MSPLRFAPLVVAAGWLFAAESVEIPNPAPAGSGQAYLTTAPDGSVYLAWIEPSGKGHRLQYAQRTGDSWRSLGSIASGENWFVNWADYPTLLPLGNEEFAAHWLEKAGATQYTYGIKIAQSRPGKTPWRVAFAPKVPRKGQYTGFVSLVALPGGGIGGSYLAPGLKGGEGEEDKSLHFVRIAPDGSVVSDDLIDPDVCTCCQTAAAVTADGPIVAYRDHLGGEIRDISVVRLINGKWTAPHPLHEDGWHINACPVNGPALAASGREVTAAWYTGADDKPAVYAAFSSDSGATFGSPVRIDQGAPLGRVGLVQLPDGEAIVSWIEKIPGADGSVAGAQIRIRRVDSKGHAGPAQTVTPINPGRSSGFPKMVHSNGKLLLAWTSDRVRTAEIPLPSR